MRTYRHVLILPSIFIVLLLGYSLNWFYDLYGDVTTAAAERVLAGQIPYRDFWTMYAPGSFYLLAFLFKIFGQHVLVGAVAGSAFFAASACLCYQLVTELTGNRIAAILSAAIFFSVTMAAGYYQSLGPYPPVIFCVLTALNLMAVYYRTHNRACLVAAGLASGLAVLFKHDVAGYAAISIVIGLGTRQLLDAGVCSRAKLVHCIRNSAIYAAGILVVALPVATYFLVVAGEDMVQDLIVFPGTDFRLARPQTYPSILPVSIYDEWRLKMLFNAFAYLKHAIPFALLLIGLFALGMSLKTNENRCLPLGLTFSLAFLFHYGSAHVQINTNIISMSMYAACLGALSFDLFRRITDLNSVRVPGFIAALSVSVWLTALLFEPTYNYLSRDWSSYSELQIPKVSGISLKQDIAKSLVELSNFVQKRVPADQKIYIGAHRHDVVLTEDLGAYFVVDRINATRYDQIHPGVVDRQDTQREMISDLEKNNTQFLIIRAFLEDADFERIKLNRIHVLPNSNSDLLDRYIRTFYTPAYRFGRYTVWQKKPPSTLGKGLAERMQR